MFALLWIILSIVWTWILILFSWRENNNDSTETLTQEQLQEFINKSNTWWTVELWTPTYTNTGETE